MFGTRHKRWIATKYHERNKIHKLQIEQNTKPSPQKCNENRGNELKPCFVVLRCHFGRASCFFVPVRQCCWRCAQRSEKMFTFTFFRNLLLCQVCIQVLHQQTNPRALKVTFRVCFLRSWCSRVETNVCVELFISLLFFFFLLICFFTFCFFVFRSWPQAQLGGVVV